MVARGGRPRGPPLHFMQRRRHRRLFAIVSAFSPLNWVCKHFAAICQCDAVLRPMPLYDLGAGFCGRLLQEYEEARKGGELSVCSCPLRLSMTSFRFLPCRDGKIFCGGDGQVSVAPAEFKGDVAIKPIAVTKIASLKAAGFSEEFGGPVRPTSQDPQRLFRRPYLLKQLQQMPQTRSAGCP